MYMPYTTNPHLPKVRMRAVLKVRSGWAVRQTARYFGVQPGTISKWVKRAPLDGRLSIPTQSSRPHNHPNQLSSYLVKKIIEYRCRNNRCSEVVHRELFNDGHIVSLSSVKRTLDRYGLIKKRSKWKKFHKYIPRPEVKKPGDLVQIDTIHVWRKQNEPLLYIYTLLDVCSRFAYAKVVKKMNTYASIKFLTQAQKYLPFDFKILQSDHGTEFSKHFTRYAQFKGLTHRHSRVRKPNDNAHLERFNRTIQNECLSKYHLSFINYQKALPPYLNYYNYHRLHLGINLITPAQCFQAID